MNEYMRDIVAVGQEILRMSRLARLKNVQYKLANIKKLRTEMVEVSASRTMFILGSGGSVSKLGQRELEFINDNFSIGLNFWLIHDFIPKLYLAESSHIDSRNAIFSELLRLKERDYRNVQFFLHHDDRATYGRSERLRFPASILNNVRAMPRWKFPILSRCGLAWALKFWYIYLWRFGPYHGIGSIVAATTFAISLGFREIVLVGVDLNNTDYFWEKDNKYQLVPKPEKIESGSIHYTADSSKAKLHHRQLSVQDQIGLILDVLCRSHDIKISVASRDSMLASIMPVYEFK